MPTSKSRPAYSEIDYPQTVAFTSSRRPPAQLSQPARAKNKIACLRIEHQKLLQVRVFAIIEVGLACSCEGCRFDEGEGQSMLRDWRSIGNGQD